MARLFEVGAASRERSAPHTASERLGAQSRFALSPVSETSSGRRRVASLRRPREKSGEVGAYLVQRHVRVWIVKRAAGADRGQIFGGLGRNADFARCKRFESQRRPVDVVMWAQ